MLATDSSTIYVPFIELTSILIKNGTILLFSESKTFVISVLALCQIPVAVPKLILVPDTSFTIAVPYSEFPLDLYMQWLLYYLSQMLLMVF